MPPALVTLIALVAAGRDAAVVHAADIACRLGAVLHAWGWARVGHPAAETRPAPAPTPVASRENPMRIAPSARRFAIDFIPLYHPNADVVDPRPLAREVVVSLGVDTPPGWPVTSLGARAYLRTLGTYAKPRLPAALFARVERYVAESYVAPIVGETPPPVTEDKPDVSA